MIIGIGTAFGNEKKKKVNRSLFFLNANLPLHIWKAKKKEIPIFCNCAKVIGSLMTQMQKSSSSSL